MEAQPTPDLRGDPGDVKDFTNARCAARDII
jgi:hypothetical protein